MDIIKLYIPFDDLALSGISILDHEYMILKSLRLFNFVGNYSALYIIHVDLNDFYLSIINLNSIL